MPPNVGNVRAAVEAFRSVGLGVQTRSGACPASALMSQERKTHIPMLVSVKRLWPEKTWGRSRSKNSFSIAMRSRVKMCSLAALRAVFYVENKFQASTDLRLRNGFLDQNPKKSTTYMY